MKKFLSIFSVAILAISLAACGSNNSGTENTNSSNGDSGESIKPENIVMGFVPSQDSDSIADTVQPLADRLGEELGVEVRGRVMT